MLLSKELLLQVSMFEHSTDTSNRIPKDKFVIYFKQWWKRRKTIFIERTMFDFSNDGSYKHRSADSAIQLLTLLENCMRATYSDTEKAEKKYTTTDTNNIIELIPRNE